MPSLDDQFHGLDIRMFAIYLTMLRWKTYKYYYETDELPNPRLTLETDRKKPSNPTKFSANALLLVESY